MVKSPVLIRLFSLLYSHVESNHGLLDFQDENHLVIQVHAHCLDCDLFESHAEFGWNLFIFEFLIMALFLKVWCLVICFRVTWHACGKHRSLGLPLQIYWISVSDIKFESLCFQQVFHVLRMNSKVWELLACVDAKFAIFNYFLIGFKQNWGLK